jgi:hypothetical protein
MMGCVSFGSVSYPAPPAFVTLRSRTRSYLPAQFLGSTPVVTKEISTNIVFFALMPPLAASTL